MNNKKKVELQLQNPVEKSLNTSQNIKSMSTRTEERLQAYNTCNLCGSQLSFVHETFNIEQSVIEENYCPICCVRGKKNIYPVQ